MYAICTNHEPQDMAIQFGAKLKEGVLWRGSSNPLDQGMTLKTSLHIKFGQYKY